MKRLKAIGRFICEDKPRSLHLAAIAFEFMATVLIFLDCLRLNSMVAILGNASFAGEPDYLRRWYFHGFAYGFGFLLMGIVLQTVALFLHSHKAK